MNKFIVSKLSLLFLLITSDAVVADELTAEQVMSKNNTRYIGDTRESTSQLVLIDKKGNQRIRSLKIYELENESVEKSIIYFLSPSEIKGTSYMSFDWTDKNKEDDSWLYLPSLQQVKRIANSAQSSSFLGSDFSYADINGLDHEDFNYSFVNNSELVNGVDCWVINAVAKNEAIVEETGYSSFTAWITKDNFIQIKAKMIVEKGDKIKYFSASDIVETDGIWRAKTLQMLTTDRGKKQHASILKYDNTEYNVEVDLSRFDTQAMQRGL